MRVGVWAVSRLQIPEEKVTFLSFPEIIRENEWNQPPSIKVFWVRPQNDLVFQEAVGGSLASVQRAMALSQMDFLYITVPMEQVTS